MTATDESLQAQVPGGGAEAEPHDEAERVDVPLLSRHLDGRWGEVRRRSRVLMTDPRFAGPVGATMEDFRSWTFDRLRLLVTEGEVHRAFPERLGGDDDAGGNIAAYEELLVGDPSLQIKAGVQWGLFGAAILHLGTPEQQDRLLPGAMDLSVPGAFAMTETGHGSDVASLATTATYDPASQTFDLHTPFRGAWKQFLGNAARDGVAAVVFAQLVVDGVGHGVHAFYVPIREVGPDGRAGGCLPGVTGADDGDKGGLRGVDNGRLAFEHVAVPRENLLARYGSVDADGVYSSPIASPGRRFFTMLGSLVQGRVSLDGAAGVASKMALAIAVTYGNQRRQFPGPDPTAETVLLDYSEHRRRLLPLLAEAYAGHFAHEQLLVAFHDVFSGATDTPTARQHLETLAAALKPAATWRALRTLQTAREACGGAGYLAENRLTGLRADLDVYATFEGDNTVLLQLVGKRLVSDHGRELRESDVGGVARMVFVRAAETVRSHTPFERASQALADSGSVRRAAGHLRKGSTQRGLLADRVQTLTEQLAGALRAASKASPQAAAALFDEHQHGIVELGRAYADLVLWDAMAAGVRAVPDAPTRRVLKRLRNLFALTTIERELSWYLIHGRLSAQRARLVHSSVDRLCAQLRPHAQDLVDALGYGSEHLRAAIASGAEAERQDEARRCLAERRARGEDPRPEGA